MPNYVVSIIIEAKDQNTKQIAAEVAEAIRGLGEQGEETGQKLRDAFSGAVLTYAFGRAIPLAREAIETYVQGQSALSGLRSMARATGVDYDTALDQLKAFTSDGLVPMEDATVALRNLLQHGFGLNEAMQILERFKDAAAYGRKEQIELGDAVRIASEAVKVGSQRGLDSISIVGDMSAAHRGLAGELGIEADKLSDAQRLQAEYTSIITQTNTAVGDSAKLHGELAGKIAEAAEKSRQAKEAIGGALAPAYSSLIDSVTPAFEGIARFADECPRATTALIGGAGLVAAVGGVATAFALMGPTGAIVVGVIAGILAIAGAVTALLDKLNPSSSALEENAMQAGDLGKQVKALSAEYDALKDKPNKSAEEHERLRDVIKELAGIVPDAVAAFDAEGKAIDLNLKALGAYSEAQAILKQHYIEQLEGRRAEKLRQLGEAQRELNIALCVSNAYTSTATKENAGFATAQADVTAKLGGSADAEKYAAMTADELRAAIVELAAKAATLERESGSLGMTLNRLTGDLQGTGDAAADVLIKTDGLALSLTDLLGADRDVFEPMSRTARTFGGAVFDLDMAVWKLWSDNRSGAEDAEDAFESARAAAEAFAHSLSGRLAQMGRGWSNWESGATDAIGEVGSNMAQFLGAVVSGNKEATDRLKEFWEGFFSWLVQKAMEIFVYWLLGRVLSSFGFVGASNAVGAFAGSAINDKLPKMVTREIGAGLSVSGRGSSGLAVEQIADLTRELRLLVPVLATASAGGGRVIEEHHHWHVATMDAASLRREIRNGELGREIRLAQRAGRVGR